MTSGPPSTPGDRAVRFINNLTLTEEYAGRPFRLRPWQEEIVRDLFGTLDEQGLRLYTEALLFIPRKNGKTELSAGIGLYGTHGIGKPGQEVLLAASDRKQASHLFKKAVAIVEADPYLARRSRTYTSAKIIEHKPTGNTMEVVSADARRQHGHNPSLVIIDEIHAQPNRDLYEALKRSFATRKERLLLNISTAGNRRDSLIYEMYEYACKVRDGRVINPKYYPVIFEAGPDDDWMDPATWHKANPALGDFCEMKELLDAFEKAKEIPAEESGFRQFNLNQWVSNVSKWLRRGAWDRCGGIEVDPEALVGEECFGGLDLANTSDIAALVLLFPDGDDFKAVQRFWIPRGYAEECDRKRNTKYLQWAKDGLITLTDGDVIDYELIVREIVGDPETGTPGLVHKYDVREIRVDQWNAEYICSKLVDAGANAVTMRNGMASMCEPTKHLDMLIARGNLHHGNNAVLNWMADNAAVEKDPGGNRKISKSHSADKVDGLVAMVMALAGWMRFEPPPTASVLWIDG